MNRICVSALSLMFVIVSGTAFAAKKEKPRKLRRNRERADETSVELTATGKKLEAKYGNMMKSLKAEIEMSLPKIDDARKAALVAAYNAEEAPAKDVLVKARNLRKLRSQEASLRNLLNLQKYVPKMMADADAQLKRALAMPDRDPNKQKAVDSAKKYLASRIKERDKYPGQIEKAKKGVEDAKVAIPKAEKDYDDATKKRDQQKAKTLKVLEGLGIENVVANNTLDEKLARYMILSEATPRFLAEFAQQGPEKEALIDRLLSDEDLMLQMLVADGPCWEKYGPAMEIYTAIQKASPKAKEGVLQKLAMAVSLVHSVPMKQTNAIAIQDKAPQYVEPVKRYLSYEKWYLNGELDKTFKDHSVWNLKMVVDSQHPDEMFVWCRKMLGNLRPDHIPDNGDTSRYVNVVDTEITYSSKGVKNDLPEKHFMQNILANGGICGRRAFFGRFTLRAFGVPTSARKEPGHATLAQWTPDGWIPRLGGNWGGRNAVGRTQMPRYGKGLHFVANAQARENAKGYLKVKRAQWIGTMMGEYPVYGRFTDEKKKNQPELSFWHAVALAEQQQIIDALGATVNFSGGSKEQAPVKISETDRKITIDSKGVITIPAVACSNPTSSTKNLFKGTLRDGVVFIKEKTGGALLHLSRYSKASDTFEYTFDAPKAGKYQLTATFVTPKPGQRLFVTVNGGKEVATDLPYTVGMWDDLKPVQIQLKKGENVLTFFGPARITVSKFTLTPAK